MRAGRAQRSPRAGARVRRPRNRFRQTMAAPNTTARASPATETVAGRSRPASARNRKRWPQRHGVQDGPAPYDGACLHATRRALGRVARKAYGDLRRRSKVCDGRERGEEREHSAAERESTVRADANGANIEPVRTGPGSGSAGSFHSGFGGARRARPPPCGVLNGAGPDAMRRTRRGPAPGYNRPRSRCGRTCDVRESDQSARRGAGSGARAPAGSPKKTSGRRLREVRTALLEADVALPVVREFIERVRARAVGRDVSSQASPRARRWCGWSATS